MPAAELGSRNLAELLLQLVVSQSDQIIGKQGRKYVPFFATFFVFILVSNLLGLLPGFAPPTGQSQHDVRFGDLFFHRLQRDWRARTGRRLF